MIEALRRFTHRLWLWRNDRGSHNLSELDFTGDKSRLRFVAEWGGPKFPYTIPLTVPPRGGGDLIAGGEDHVLPTCPDACLPLGPLANATGRSSVPMAGLKVKFSFGRPTIFVEWMGISKYEGCFVLLRAIRFVMVASGKDFLLMGRQLLPSRWPLVEIEAVCLSRMTERQLQADVLHKRRPQPIPCSLVKKHVIK
jgi:hypothetical protein